jgi:multiple sugar transport system substrate-binding protein
MTQVGPRALSRHDFLKQASVAAGGLVGAAALDRAEAAGRETEGQRYQTTLVFWAHDFPPRAAIDRKIIKEFERQNPQVKVNYTTYPEPGYETKLLTAMGSQTGPDLFNVYTGITDPLVLGNAVAPVDAQVMGYASIGDLVKSYIPGFLEGFTWNGRLYALPTEVSNYALYINKLHFKEAGLDPAKDYPRTWDDVVRVARKLTIVKNGKVLRRGFEFEYVTPNDWTSSQWDLAGMAYQHGGLLYNADSTASLVDQAPWVTALTVYYDYVHTYKLGFPAMQDDADSFMAGKEGAVSMLLSGYWFASSVRDTNKLVYENLMTAPFPRFKDATHSNGALKYAYAHFVNASISAEKQKLAWRLIGMLDSQPAQYLAGAGLLQPRKVLLDSPTYRNDPLIKPFLKDAQTTPYRPSNVHQAEVDAAVGRAIQRSTQTAMPPRQSLAIAKQDIDKILKGV